MATHDDRLFYGAPVEIARYDVQKYPIFEKLTRQQIGYFWTPEEVSLTRDVADFRALSDAEQHIFTSNIKRQIVLDTKQGVAPSLAFLPIASQPELETWIQTWAFFETIHSRSYTHIIRNIYNNPSEVFDNVLNIPEVSACARDIAIEYDTLIEANRNKEQNPEALWKALNSVNILEGIRFYVSFACSWAFAEQKKAMEGNAKIIRFIARDENLHLASTQHLIKLLPKSDPELFGDMPAKCNDMIVEMFRKVVDQEIEWSKYLFKDGSMIGLNHEMLVSYLHWLANRRMSTLGLPNLFKASSNPLPWTKRWIGGESIQTAAQESEIASYIIGGIKQDIDANTFKGFEL